MKDPYPAIRWKKGTPGEMAVKRTGDVLYLADRRLEEWDWLMHGFSTRMGGVSTGIYRSMNLSFLNGDLAENVMENYRRAGNAIGFRPEQVVAFSQIHSARVVEVTGQDAGSGVTGPVKERADGMVTQDCGVVLEVMTADCVPILFADPVRRCIGAAHSGWRGTVARIGREVIETMQDLYASHPEDIFAAIGPSVCKDCYEVSGDVIEEVEKTFDGRGRALKLYSDGKEEGKYQLDLWEMNRRILLEAGLLPEHILMPDLCTCCNPEFLFSHRASKGRRGTLASFIGMKALQD